MQGYEIIILILGIAATLGMGATFLLYNLKVKEENGSNPLIGQQANGLISGNQDDRVSGEVDSKELMQNDEVFSHDVDLPFLITQSDIKLREGTLDDFAQRVAKRRNAKSKEKSKKRFDK